LAAVGVVAIIAAAVVLKVTGIASAIFSAVGVASVVLPVAFALTAYSLYALTAYSLYATTAFSSKVSGLGLFESSNDLRKRSGSTASLSGSTASLSGSTASLNKGENEASNRPDRDEEAVDLSM